MPLNPEEDGWHHVKECPDSSAKIVFWSGHGGNTHYENGDLKHHEGWDGYPLWIAEEWRYLGPVFTPDGTAALIARIAELEAALATARRDAMEEAARIAENEPEPEGEPPIELHGRSVKNIAISSVRATKHSIAAAIRAALEGGKKDE